MTGTPALLKSAVLRVATVKPCTRAVVAIRLSLIGMALPDAVGQSWGMYGGPHGWSGTAAPWSSIDLAGGDQVVRAVLKGRDFTYQLGNPGRHMAVNSLGALAAVNALGLDLGAATAVHQRGPAEEYRSGPGRFQMAGDGAPASSSRSRPRALTKARNASPLQLRIQAWWAESAGLSVATAVQTVGAKGYDGFAIAIRLDLRQGLLLLLFDVR